MPNYDDIIVKNNIYTAECIRALRNDLCEYLLICICSYIGKISTQKYNIENKLREYLHVSFGRWFFMNTVDFTLENFKIFENDILYFLKHHANIKTEVRVSSIILPKYDENPYITYIMNKPEFTNDIKNNIVKYIAGRIQYEILPRPLSDFIRNDVVINNKHYVQWHVGGIKLPPVDEAPLKKFRLCEQGEQRMASIWAKYVASNTVKYMCSTPVKIIMESGIGCELFASPFDTTRADYCSSFPEETEFGSRGNFFNYELASNRSYWAFPPHSQDFISTVVPRLLKQLQKTTNIVIYLIIPVWDTDAQRDLNIKDYGTRFEPYYQLKNSTYNKECVFLNKYNHCYYEHVTNRFIDGVHSHLFVLSNSSARYISAKYLSNVWSELKYKNTNLVCR